MTGQPPQPGNQAVGSSPRNNINSGIVSAFRHLFQARTISAIPRLFREGPAPIFRLLIQAHNTAEISRLLKDGVQLNFVSSYPRSGNTWMRYLLSDIFFQNHGVQTTTELPVHPDKIVPDFYCHWIARRDVTLATPGVFVKTHDAFEQLESRFCRALSSRDVGNSPFRNARHVYFYRSPEDALVSHYHYHARQKHMRAKMAGGVDAFCLEHLSSWEANLGSYLRAESGGARVFFVPYELLLQYPTEVFSNILRWIGATHDTASVERAVSNMQFNKLQAIEARNPFQEEAFFFRRGCKGSGRTELQPATLAQIHERTVLLLDQASQCVMKQSQLRVPASSKTAQIRRDAASPNRQSKRILDSRNLQKI